LLLSVFVNHISYIIIINYNILYYYNLLITFIIIYIFVDSLVLYNDYLKLTNNNNNYNYNKKDDDIELRLLINQLSESNKYKFIYKSKSLNNIYE